MFVTHPNSVSPYVQPAHNVIGKFQNPPPSIPPALALIDAARGVQEKHHISHLAFVIYKTIHTHNVDINVDMGLA